MLWLSPSFPFFLGPVEVLRRTSLLFFFFLPHRTGFASAPSLFFDQVVRMPRLPSFPFFFPSDVGSRAAKLFSDAEARCPPPFLPEGSKVPSSLGCGESSCHSSPLLFSLTVQSALISLFLTPSRSKFGLPPFSLLGTDPLRIEGVPLTSFSRRSRVKGFLFPLLL